MMTLKYNNSLGFKLVDDDEEKDRPPKSLSFMNRPPERFSFMDRSPEKLSFMDRSPAKLSFMYTSPERRSIWDCVDRIILELSSSYEPIKRKIGQPCYDKLLDASNSNIITESHLLEMARQMSTGIGDKVKSHLEKMGGYKGRSSMQYLLKVWNQELPNKVSRCEMIGILLSSEVRLNDLAIDMAESVEEKLKVIKWVLRLVYADADEDKLERILILDQHSKYPKMLNTGFKKTVFNLCMGLSNPIINACYPRVSVPFFNNNKMTMKKGQLTKNEKYIKKEEPLKKIKMNEESCNNNLPKSSENYGYWGKNREITELLQERQYEHHLKKKTEKGEMKKIGMDLTSANKVSILATLMMFMAKMATGISKTFTWATIFSVLTGAVTCSLSSTSGELVPTEFQLSEFTTLHEIPLPTFSYNVDYEAATIEKTDITDSMEGCQLILHIEISHVEGIHSDKIGETVFYAEHPNLGCGLQKFSMLSDERNIWKEKRFCFFDCHNGVKTPLLLSATSNLTEARNIIIVPEIRNDGCKTMENSWGFLPTILFITFSMIFLVAMVSLLLKEYGKTTVMTILKHQEENIEKQTMINAEK